MNILLLALRPICISINMCWDQGETAIRGIYASPLGPLKRIESCSRLRLCHGPDQVNQGQGGTRNRCLESEEGICDHQTRQKAQERSKFPAGKRRATRSTEDQKCPEANEETPCKGMQISLLQLNSFNSTTGHSRLRSNFHEILTNGTPGQPHCRSSGHNRAQAQVLGG